MQIAKGKGETWRGDRAAHRTVVAFIWLACVWIVAMMLLIAHRSLAGGFTGPVRDGQHYLMHIENRAPPSAVPVTAEAYARLQWHERITFWICPLSWVTGLGLVLASYFAHRKGQREDIEHYKLSGTVARKRSFDLKASTCLSLALLHFATMVVLYFSFSVYVGRQNRTHLVDQSAKLVNVVGTDAWIVVSEQVYQLNLLFTHPAHLGVVVTSIAFLLVFGAIWIIRELRREGSDNQTA